jgi:hypothetical protein
MTERTLRDEETGERFRVKQVGTIDSLTFLSYDKNHPGDPVYRLIPIPDESSDEKSNRKGLVRRTFTVWLDEATYGSTPDDEEIAFLLRMGGIDARIEKPDEKCEPCAGTGKRHSMFDFCFCEPRCDGDGYGECGACEGSGRKP